MTFAPRTWLAAGLLIATASGDVFAQARESRTVDQSASVLREISAVPDRGIPAALLEKAQGFALFPGMVKAGFVVGGRFGRGVVVVRDASTGAWSNPLFVMLAGGSVGWQIGAQATDLVLVFRTRRSVEGFLNGRGKFTLGADASVAAGPVGRQVGAGTDVRLESEILTYSRTRGLFAGASLEGASLKLTPVATAAYYGRAYSPSEVLTRPDIATPGSAIRLKTVLSQLTGAPLVVPAPKGESPPNGGPAPPPENPAG